MDDLISRQAAIDVIDKIFPVEPMRNDYTEGITCGAALATEYIKQLPSVQPEKDIIHLQKEQAYMQGWADGQTSMLKEYDIEHLVSIAMLLQKENLPPERIKEILSDVGRIVEIVCDEFEESLRNTMEVQING